MNFKTQEIKRITVKSPLIPFFKSRATRDSLCKREDGRDFQNPKLLRENLLGSDYAGLGQIE
jgi:hypothetical protein